MKKFLKALAEYLNKEIDGGAELAHQGLIWRDVQFSEIAKGQMNLWLVNNRLRFALYSHLSDSKLTVKEFQANYKDKLILYNKLDLGATK